MHYHGFLVINKPPGLTSHQVVAELRKILSMKRIGHTGTLDPAATGTLVVALGIGTKLIPYLQEEKKTYLAQLVLGITTDTQDITGEVIAVHPETRVGRAQLAQALQKFTGPLEQIPPMFSAVKLNGQPLYKLAREGKTVPRKTRAIYIHDLQIQGRSVDYYKYKKGPELLVVCSKGTYIRTLCHDLGEYLGCGACMGSLVRLASGTFTIKQASSLEEVTVAEQNNTIENLLVSPVQALNHLETVILNQKEEKRVSHGNSITATDCQGELGKAVTADGRLIAILKKQMTESGLYWQPVKVLSTI